MLICVLCIHITSVCFTKGNVPRNWDGLHVVWSDKAKLLEEPLWVFKTVSLVLWFFFIFSFFRWYGKKVALCMSMGNPLTCLKRQWKTLCQLLNRMINTLWKTIIDRVAVPFTSYHKSVRRLLITFDTLVNLPEDS